MSDDTKATNPLMARVNMPGETFKLPSVGVLYDDNELADGVVDGELSVLPMTAYDEILMRTPDLLFSGESIKQVFKRCIPQVNKPMALFAKDVDFLLLCLRKVTYGDTMEVSYTHTCDNAKEHNYLADVAGAIRAAKVVDPSTISTTYVHKLGNGQKIKLRPVKFDDAIKLLQAYRDEDVDPKAAAEKEYALTISAVLNIIAAVDDVEDKGMIEEWLKALSAGWVKEISSTVEQISQFGVEFTHTFKCKDCGDDVEITVPINPIGFFI